MSENKRKIFISYSHTEQNKRLKENLATFLSNKNLIIDKSEREDKSNLTDETIWKHLEQRIKGSTITIVLLTKDLFLNNKHKLNYVVGSFLDSGWIYNEISASLRNWDANKINGIIVVYEPEAEEYIQKNQPSKCTHCANKSVNMIHLGNKIIRKNMFNINEKFKMDKNCEYHDSEEDNFISLVSLNNFKNNPSKYIENAFAKREKQINSNNNYFTIEYNFHKKDN
ncbi:MAG: toll/interleukin-1 receptor domain-containing protein [Mycoplasmataceae bacterium]|nr:toll/interleukin-1 receptor domain-containing protein [Mycoplasmataceae bacterium]